MVDIRSWLSTDYLRKETLASAASIYTHNKPQNIQLTNIFGEQRHKSVLSELSRVAWKEKYDPLVLRCNTSLLPLELSQFLHSDEFKFFISTITNKIIHQTSADLFSFGHRDYTLMNDVPLPNGIFFQLDFTPAWDDGFGGYTSFVSDGEQLRISPSANTLTLVDTTKLNRFTKYINHKAGKNKRILVEGMFK